MKLNSFLAVGFVFVLCLGIVIPAGFAQKKMPDTVTLKLEGKMPPVTFSHTTHTQKEKIDCAVCHHKDKDPKQPQACRTCHQIGKVNDGAPPVTDAFHKKCQTCHKESAAKGKKAPTQCMECHKQ